MPDPATDPTPDQPDGIADDSHDLPDPARAAERVGEFLQWYGDGLIEVPWDPDFVDGPPPPLYARDLESLRKAADATRLVPHTPPAQEVQIDTRPWVMAGETILDDPDEYRLDTFVRHDDLPEIITAHLAANNLVPHTQTDEALSAERNLTRALSDDNGRLAAELGRADVREAKYRGEIRKTLAELAHARRELDEARQGESDEANAYRLRKTRSDHQATEIERLRRVLGDARRGYDIAVNQINTYAADLTKARRDLEGANRDAYNAMEQRDAREADAHRLDEDCVRLRDELKEARRDLETTRADRDSLLEHRARFRELWEHGQRDEAIRWLGYEPAASVQLPDDPGQPVDSWGRPFGYSQVTTTNAVESWSRSAGEVDDAKPQPLMTPEQHAEFIAANERAKADPEAAAQASAEYMRAYYERLQKGPRSSAGEAKPADLKPNAEDFNSGTGNESRLESGEAQQPPEADEEISNG